MSFFSNLFSCWTPWEETLAKAKKARRTAERFEDDHSADARDLRTQAENAYTRGDAATARKLLIEASREQRRASRFTVLRNDATDMSDFAHSTKIRGDLMQVQEEVSLQAEGETRGKSGSKSAAKQGARLADFNQHYKQSKAVLEETVALDSSGEDEEEDDFDAAWVDQNLDAIRLKVEEQQSEWNARAASKAAASKMKKKVGTLGATSNV